MAKEIKEEAKIRLDNEGYKRLLILIDEAEKELKAAQGAYGQGVANGGAGSKTEDNFDAESAKNDIERANLKLKRLRATLYYVDVVEPTNTSGVNVGDVVTLLEEGIEDSYLLVSYSANLDAKEISDKSRLGIAIKGANIGATRTYESCGVTYSVVITNIQKVSTLSENQPQRTK